MRNILTFIIILIIGLVNASAQSLSKLMTDETKNYNDIITEIKNNKKYLEEASPKEVKMYDRWKWFWNTRVDDSGSFEKYNIEMNNCFNEIYPAGVVGSSPTLKSAFIVNMDMLGTIKQTFREQ